MFQEGEVVWHRQEDKLWWPACIVEVVECLREQVNVFNLYHVQPFDRNGGLFAEAGQLLKFDAMPRQSSLTSKMRLALTLAQKKHERFLKVLPDQRPVKELRSCLKSQVKRASKRVTWRDQQPSLTIDSETKKTVIERLAGKIRRVNRKLTSRQAWNLAVGFERESQCYSKNQSEYQSLISRTIEEVSRMGTRTKDDYI